MEYFYGKLPKLKSEFNQFVCNKHVSPIVGHLLTQRCKEINQQAVELLRILKIYTWV